MKLPSLCPLPLHNAFRQGTSLKLVLGVIEVDGHLQKAVVVENVCRERFNGTVLVFISKAIDVPRHVLRLALGFGKALRGRIPALITDGRLESRAGVPLTADNAHAMLCGNPAMVDDVQAALAARGMRRRRRKEPGHITLETYW